MCSSGTVGDMAFFSECPIMFSQMRINDWLGPFRRWNPHPADSGFEQGINDNQGGCFK